MKRLVLLSLLSLSSPAEAQVFPWSGGGSGGGTPDPGRNDTASSYTATGPNGVRTVPQVNPAALGTCSALAGAWAATTPDYESQVRPYFCDGTRWTRIWTDEDGVTVSPDRSVAARTFVSQAASGDYAFKANNRPIWDLGDGVSDELVSLGSRIRSMASLELNSGQALYVDVLANTTLNGDIAVSTTRYFKMLPAANAPCAAGNAGGIQARAGDGNRLYHCDGTASYRIPRVIPISATLTIPTMVSGEETALSTTVTGAAVGDHVSVNMGCDVAQIGIRRVRVSAANTVTVYVYNGDLVASLPSPTDCLFLGVVHK